MYCLLQRRLHDQKPDPAKEPSGKMAEDFLLNDNSLKAMSNSRKAENPLPAEPERHRHVFRNPPAPGKAPRLSACIAPVAA